jgi:iron complex outermembrane receptor protein
MKFKYFTLMLFSAISVLAIGQNSLHGKITDATNGQTIPGAIVYLPELKMGTTSDSTGKYYLPSLPRGSYQVEVKLLSYATAVKQVTINGETNVNFSLSASSASSKEVVITALGNTTTLQRSPVPVTLVSHEMFIQQASTNAVDAIAKEPGVTAISEGPGISKPEINGLGFNRVLTLFDGERQEDFQWGDEHGILIDPYAVYDAEIIRGPASLQYGNYAVAGVINFKSEPLPEDGTTTGSILTEYQTNNGLIGNSFDIAGNHNGFTWDLRGSQEEAHCYQDPKDGYVWGTAFTSSNIRGTIGLNEKWGFSRLSVSILHRQLEIPDGNRDSATGQFEFDVPQANAYGGNPQYVNGILVPGTGQVYPTKANFLSYNSALSSVYQILDHDEIWWQNNINVSNNARILADIGYSQSKRQEIDTGTVTEEGLTVHDIPYSFKYQVVGDSSGLKLTTGINGMYEWNTDFAEPTAPYKGIFEIPFYTDMDLGGYAILNWDPKSIKNLSMSAGLRYDYRSMVGQPMYLAYDNTSSQVEVPSSGVSGSPGYYTANSNQNVVPVGTSLYTQFPALNNTYNGLSASLGATYQLPENNYVKANLAKTYRAPSILELMSNETDPANEYKQGDINLKGESGYELDLAYGNNGKDVSFEVDGFYNFIQNFIFANRISSKLSGDSLIGGVPVYHFGSANNAYIEGVSAFFNIHPSDSKYIEVDNGFTYTYSYILNATDSTNHVPWTPAARLTSEVRLKISDRHHSVLKGTYIAFGLAHYWAQDEIYSALWNELPSTAYTLYNAGVGTNFVNPRTGRVVCSFYLNCTNLTNIAYLDHTSRTQYFWSYNGAYAGQSNYGLTPATVTKPTEGIYNMGRNVGFKLLFPIGGHKTSDTEMKGMD